MSKQRGDDWIKRGVPEDGPRDGSHGVVQANPALSRQ